MNSEIESYDDDLDDLDADDLDDLDLDDLDLDYLDLDDLDLDHLDHLEISSKSSSSQGRMIDVDVFDKSPVCSTKGGPKSRVQYSTHTQCHRCLRR